MSIISVKQALNYGFSQLKKVDIPSPRLDAEILLGFVLDFTSEKMLINQYLNISISKYLKFKKLIKKRAKNTPIAYLIGKKEFYGIDFYVNEDVLVPRPETELLVEEVLGFVGAVGYVGSVGSESHSTNPTNPNILEIGTGSGCIALTLAKYLPYAKITAVDISEKALAVTRKNKNILISKYPNISNVKLRKSNLLDKIKFKPDILIANLPYLTKEELKEPSISKEPHLALYGGKDGLALYEKLLKQIKQKFIREISDKISEDSRLAVFMEINPSQKTKLKKIIKKYFPKAEIGVKKDLAGRDRVVVLKI